MKNISALIFSMFLMSATLLAQPLTSEKSFKEYFQKNKSKLDSVEGIWQINTKQLVYHHDTLFDESDFNKSLKIAVIRHDTVFDTYDMTGKLYNVQLYLTDVKGVYLYKNYFPETKSYTRTNAVISARNIMEYTIELPEAYLQYVYKDTYEPGERVKNQLRWEKVFP